MLVVCTTTWLRDVLQHFKQPCPFNSSVPVCRPMHKNRICTLSTVAQKNIYRMGFISSEKNECGSWYDHLLGEILDVKTNWSRPLFLHFNPVEAGKSARAIRQHQLFKAAYEPMYINVMKHVPLVYENWNWSVETSISLLYLGPFETQYNFLGFTVKAPPQKKKSNLTSVLFQCLC